MTAAGRYVAARAFRVFVVQRGFRADGREWVPGEVCPEASSWPTVRALINARYLVAGEQYREGDEVRDAAAWVNVERLVEAGFVRCDGAGADDGAAIPTEDPLDGAEPGPPPLPSPIQAADHTPRGSRRGKGKGGQRSSRGRRRRVQTPDAEG